MKSITSILAILALGTTLAVAVDEAKPAEKPAVDKPATAKPDAPKGEKPKGDKPKKDPAEAFKKLDANDDGKITAEEWATSPMAKRDAAKATEAFGKKDKDGDKSLSLEEFADGGKKKDK